MRSTTEVSKRPIEQSWKQTKFVFSYLDSKNNFFSRKKAKTESFAGFKSMQCFYSLLKMNNQKRWEAAHLLLP